MAGTRPAMTMVRSVPRGQRRSSVATAALVPPIVMAGLVPAIHDVFPAACRRVNPPKKKRRPTLRWSASSKAWFGCLLSRSGRRRSGRCRSCGRRRRGRGLGRSGRRCRSRRGRCRSGLGRLRGLGRSGRCRRRSGFSRLRRCGRGRRLGSGRRRSRGSPVVGRSPIDDRENDHRDDDVDDRTAAAAAVRIPIIVSISHFATSLAG